LAAKRFEAEKDVAESPLYPIIGELLKRKLGCLHVQTQPTVVLSLI